jgi:hypothetical protein
MVGAAVSLFKLSPRDGRNPNWQRSGYVGTIIVRASSDVAAREIAGRAFVQTIDLKGTHGRMLHSPWLDAREVSCVRTEPSPLIIASHSRCILLYVASYLVPFSFSAFAASGLRVNTGFFHDFDCFFYGCHG